MEPKKVVAEPLNLKMKPGERSVEQLMHFWCRACMKWWSIGDAPAEKTEWFCPWCGEKDTYKKC